MDKKLVKSIDKTQLLQWSLVLIAGLAITILAALPSLVRPVANEGWDLPNHVAKSYYLSQYLPFIPATDIMQGAGMTFLRSYGFLGHYIYAVLLKFLDIWTAFKVYFVLCIFLSVVNTFLLARFFRLSRGAALLAAGCYVFSSFLSFEYFIAGTLPHWLAYAIFPLFLQVALSGLETSKVHSAVLSGWILGVMILIHPQIALRAAILLAIILAMYYLQQRKLTGQNAVYLAWMVVLCLLTSGFKIYEGLANLNYVVGRQRSYAGLINNPLQFISGYWQIIQPILQDPSLAATRTLTQISSHMMNDRYLGVIAVLLSLFAAWQVFNRPDRKSSPLAAILIGLLAGSIIFLIIFIFPDPLYNWLPLSSSDSGVHRVLFIPVLGIAIFAGLGLDAVQNWFAQKNLSRPVAFLLSLGIGILCIGDLFYYPTRRLPLEFGLVEPTSIPESIVSNLPRWLSVKTDQPYARFVADDTTHAAEIAQVYNHIPSLQTNMIQDFVPEYASYYALIQAKLQKGLTPHDAEILRLLGVEKVLAGNDVLTINDPLVVFASQDAVELSGSASAECFLKIVDADWFKADQTVFLTAISEPVEKTSLTRWEVLDQQACTRILDDLSNNHAGQSKEAVREHPDIRITMWKPDQIRIAATGLDFPWVEIALQYSPYWVARDADTNQPLAVYKTSAGLTAILAGEARNIELQFQDPALAIILSWVAGITSVFVLLLVILRPTIKSVSSVGK